VGPMLGRRGMVLSGEDVDNIRNMLFDADEGGDIVFFFNAFIAYATARIAVEYARLLTGPRDVSRAQTP